MSVKWLYGIRMRWLALTPPRPSPARGRGWDQNHAPGRSNAAEVALAHIFYPPLKGTGRPLVSVWQQGVQFRDMGEPEMHSQEAYQLL